MELSLQIFLIWSNPNLDFIRKYRIALLQTTLSMQNIQEEFLPKSHIKGT